MHRFKYRHRKNSKALLDGLPSQTAVNRQPDAGAPAGMPLYIQRAPHAATRNYGTAQAVLADEEQEIALLPAISGVGKETHSVAYSLTLRGRTDATFNSSFRTLNTRTTPATGCQECSGGDCAHVRGTLESTFTVATQVTLPSVTDYPDLTPCQRQRVQHAITNVLAPHEQQHVAAFRTYNGTSRVPFDLTLCRGEFEARLQAMHDAAESARRAAAQAASDALDPFAFEVDLNCEDRSRSKETPSTFAEPSSEGADSDGEDAGEPNT